MLTELFLRITSSRLSRGSDANKSWLLKVRCPTEAEACALAERIKRDAPPRFSSFGEFGSYWNARYLSEKIAIDKARVLHDLAPTQHADALHGLCAPPPQRTRASVANVGSLNGTLSALPDDEDATGADTAASDDDVAVSGAAAAAAAATAEEEDTLNSDAKTPPPYVVHSRNAKRFIALCTAEVAIATTPPRDS